MIVIICLLLVSQRQVLILLGLWCSGPSERELGELDHLGVLRVTEHGHRHCGAVVDKALQGGVIYLDRVVKDSFRLPLLLLDTGVSAADVVNQDDYVQIVIGDRDAVLVDQVPDLLVQGHSPHAAAQLLRHRLGDLPAEAVVVGLSGGVGSLGGC